LLYRVEVNGIENFSRAGERVLIVANHLSFLDGILLAVFLPKLPLFVVNTHMAQNWWVRPFLWFIRYVTIDPTNPMYVKTLIKTLNDDEAIAIFPEGRITLTGSLMKVYHGPGLVADRTDAHILPVRLDGPQYSFLSRLKGVVRRRLFPKVRITVQPPVKLDIPDDITGPARREKSGFQLEEIMQQMMFSTSHYNKTVFEALLQARAIHGSGKIIVEDINFKPVSYDGVIRAVFAIAGELRKPLLKQNAVGLMLPNTIAMVVSFLAMQVLGKVPAMMNFTMGTNGLRSAIRTAGLETIITSRKFVESAALEDVVEDLAQQVEIVYLEDIKQQIGLFRKIAALTSGWFPGIALRRCHGNCKADDSAVILFTSGSEGEPKGVVLSHQNLLANREQIAAVINFTPHDVMLSSLPLFHSFGLTAGVILPLLSGIKFFLYPSPLHYHIIPEIAYDIRATVLFGTNTFLAGYARKAHPYDFSSVRYAVAGAEKLQEETRRVWQEKFGIRILEGYGATETSPVLSLNTPTHFKQGTVGRLLPGIEHYLQTVEGISEGGRLVVKGPNIMRGYLLPDQPGVIQPAKTDQGEGWYDTGDIVTVDEQGFVTIAGRAKRFAKIAGEMVSLTLVEQLAGACWPEHEHIVVCIPDAKKGEQLVLLTTHENATRQELQKTVKQMGNSELTVPRLFIYQERLPLLGTGKVDYNQATTIAQNLYVA
jgi:acyl-[acyl-carrier-protein]-phospholipid O-acyltransferase/long-chain-fatty-acid--[acyl-carrier-protein] ligase